MPTVTVEGSVTLQQAATALQGKLGSRYEITAHGSGTQQALRVKQSAASTATVHLDQDGSATTFHVHGGGLVISRPASGRVPPHRWAPQAGSEGGRVRV
jgi:hypothetical protein